MRAVFTLVFLFCFSLVFAQGDCPNTASTINQCNFSYTGNNGSFSDCGYDCGGACPACVGPKSSAGIDQDCTTNAPSTNCGCDIGASIENNMFWEFTPGGNCTYELCITASNCCCNSGGGNPYMQVGVWQIDAGSVTQYHIEDPNDNNICCGNTKCYQFTVNTSDGDVLIMLDGNAGSECDVTLTVDTVGSCPACIPLPVYFYSFSAKEEAGVAVLDWKYNELAFEGVKVQRLRSNKWNTIAETDKGHYRDYDADPGVNYYRLESKDGKAHTTTRKVNIKNKTYDKIKVYDVTGSVVLEAPDKREQEIKKYLPNGRLFIIRYFKNGSTRTEKFINL